MSDNVVKLRPALDHVSVEMIWRCNCGCTSHYAHETGMIECANCGEFASDMTGEWRAPLPQAPIEPRKVEGGDVNVVELGSAPAALARTLRRIKLDETVAVIVLRKDGSISTWGEKIETAEQSEWFDRRMREAKELLEGR